METAVLSPSEAPSEAIDQVVTLLQEIRARLGEVPASGAGLDAIADQLENFQQRLADVEVITRDAAQASNGKLAEAMREFTLLERTVNKLIQPLADVKAVQDKLLEADPAAQIKSIAKTSEALIKVSSTFNDIGESLVTRLANIPQAQQVDQVAIRDMESARLGLVQAANDIIAVAQLKQKVIDRADENRYPWYIPVLSMGFGAMAAAAVVLFIQPGVDTNAEAWGRHLLADKAFAACLNQSQAPTGPAACSIRFRPDPAPAATPQKR